MAEVRALQPVLQADGLTQRARQEHEDVAAELDRLSGLVADFQEHVFRLLPPAHYDATAAAAGRMTNAPHDGGLE